VWRLGDEGLLTCEAAGKGKRESTRCLTVQRNGKVVLTFDGHSKAKCQRWRLVRCVTCPPHALTRKQGDTARLGHTEFNSEWWEGQLVYTDRAGLPPPLSLQQSLDSNGGVFA